MKYLIVFLTIMSVNLNGQDCINELDVCTKNSKLEFQMISNYWIQQIELSNMEELFEYWNPENQLTEKSKKKLIHKLEKIKNKYIKNKPGHPGVMPLETKKLIYERTFYSCDKSKLEYYAQLRIVAKNINGEYYIDDIQIHEGKSVKSRNEQVNYLRTAGLSTPPPPPPPPPFEKRKN